MMLHRECKVAASCRRTMQVKTSLGCKWRTDDGSSTRRVSIKIRTLPHEGRHSQYWMLEPDATGYPCI